MVADSLRNTTDVWSMEAHNSEYKGRAGINKNESYIIVPALELLLRKPFFGAQTICNTNEMGWAIKGILVGQKAMKCKLYLFFDWMSLTILHMKLNADTI